MSLNAAELILARSMEPAIRIRPAIYFSGKVITHAEFHALVNRAANTFLGLGVQRGDRVPLLLNDGPVYAACILGLMKIGAVVIPLNTKLKVEEYKYIATDCGAKLLVHEPAFTDVVKEIFGVNLLLSKGGKDSLTRRMDNASSHAAFAMLEEEDACFWLYSSGTTGLPKGIIHTQRGAAQSSKLMREVLMLDETGVVFCTSKLFFAFALDNALLGVIRAGAATVLNEAWADPETMAAQVAQIKPDIVLTMPTFFRRLLQLGDEKLAAFRDVPLYATGGERVPDSVALKWKEVTGHDLLACHGMSETFCNTFSNRQGEVRLGSCGKPLEGVEPMLLPRGARPGELFAAAEPIGINEPGVLWLKHPALAARYNNEKKTAESFEDGWFCTNDLFRVDTDGYWFHEGRGDELLKIAGQWVKPQEVEDAVLGERVREAACVVVLDADGFERLALYVVPVEEDSLESIEEAARAALPSHSWPKWIRSVEELPRTPTGKVQKFKLRDMMRAELGFPVEPELLPIPETPAVEPTLAEAVKPKRKSRSRAKPAGAQDTTGELPLDGAADAESNGSTESTESPESIASVEATEPVQSMEGDASIAVESKQEVAATDDAEAPAPADDVSAPAVVQDSLDAGAELSASAEAGPAETSQSSGEQAAAAPAEPLAQPEAQVGQVAMEAATEETSQSLAMPEASSEDAALVEAIEEMPDTVSAEIDAQVEDQAQADAAGTADDIEAVTGESADDEAAAEKDASESGDENADADADENAVGESEDTPAEPPSGERRS